MQMYGIDSVLLNLLSSYLYLALSLAHLFCDIINFLPLPRSTCKLVLGVKIVFFLVSVVSLSYVNAPYLVFYLFLVGFLLLLACWLLGTVICQSLAELGSHIALVDIVDTYEQTKQLREPTTLTLIPLFSIFPRMRKGLISSVVFDHFGFWIS